jgi:hypothetical protein
MIRSTLVAEGSSDRVLCRILDWVLEQNSTSPFRPCAFADFSVGGKPATTAGRVRLGLERYPCDIIFVHRDADKQNPELRYREILEAIPVGQAHVCVVPVRMQEAWLLLDEAKLRVAAGCPRGRKALAIPELKRVEQLADPKALLHSLLREASETTGRDARKFSPERAAIRLAELLDDDWHRLRELSAFRRLEADTRAALQALQSGDRK